MPSLRRRRGAFSLVELLVTIGIVLVLISILLPAVQLVREMANKMSCGSNLRELGIAAHNYNTTHSRLPPGYYGPLTPPKRPGQALPYDGNQGPWVGCIVDLLPHFEQDALRNHLCDTQREFPKPPVGYSYNPSAPLELQLDVEKRGWWTNPTNVGPQTGQMRLKLLQCPSDDLYATEVPGFALGMWTDGMLSPAPMTDANAGSNLGRTNYVGVAGCRVAPNDLRFAGVFLNRSKVSLGQVTAGDGTSNTLMFGESLGRDFYRPDKAFTWFGVGSLNTVYGIVDPKLKPTAAATFMPSSALAFGSMHRSGAQFCFADGSVRTLRFTTLPPEFTAPDKPPKLPHDSPWGIVQQLAGWNDGTSATAE